VPSRECVELITIHNLFTIQIAHIFITKCAGQLGFMALKIHYIKRNSLKPINCNFFEHRLFQIETQWREFPAISVFVHWWKFVRFGTPFCIRSIRFSLCSMLCLLTACFFPMIRGSYLNLRKASFNLNER